MIDRKKVIKGLKLCAIGSECTGRDCPYWHNVLDDAIKGCDCTTELVRDAIALLKEQEAVKPMKRIEENEWTVCGCCKNHIISKWSFCPYCGKAVNWE